MGMDSNWIWVGWAKPKFARADRSRGERRWESEDEKVGLDLTSRWWSCLLEEDGGSIDADIAVYSRLRLRIESDWMSCAVTGSIDIDWKEVGWWWKASLEEVEKFQKRIKISTAFLHSKNIKDEFKEQVKKFTGKFIGSTKRFSPSGWVNGKRSG